MSEAPAAKRKSVPKKCSNKVLHRTRQKRRAAELGVRRQQTLGDEHGSTDTFLHRHDDGRPCVAHAALSLARREKQLAVLRRLHASSAERAWLGASSSCTSATG